MRNRVWCGSSGGKRKLLLSSEQFAHFLNGEQRDPRLNELLHPRYTAEKAADMINKYESDESFRQKSKLSSTQPSKPLKLQQQK